MKLKLVIPIVLAVAAAWCGLSLAFGGYSVDGSGTATVKGLFPQYDSATERILDADESLTYELSVAESGSYNLGLHYKNNSGKVIKSSIGVTVTNADTGAIVADVDSDWRAITLDGIWYDDGERIFDRYSDQTLPRQQSYQGWLYALCENNKRSAPALSLDLSAGSYIVEVRNNGDSFILGDAAFVKREQPIAYADYIAQNAQAADNAADELIILEAEDYSYKSDSYIRAGNNSARTVLPYNPDSRLLNSIAEHSWNKSGQWLTYAVDIEKDGFYSIGVRYMTSAKQNALTYRTVLVDGVLPFAEYNAHPFEFTNGNWQTKALSDANAVPLRIYLTKGTHYITLRADNTPVAEQLSEVKRIMGEIYDFSIQIRKVTGNISDKTRTWNVEQYYPYAIPSIEGWIARLDSLYSEFTYTNDKGRQLNPTFAEGIKIAALRLSEAIKKPEQLPLRLNLISEGDSSAVKLLGDVLQTVADQPMSADRLYLMGQNREPEQIKDSLASGLLASTRSFLLSFTGGGRYSNYKSDDALNIWVSLPIAYVQLLQQLADTRFTPQTGIKVNLSLMPGDQKLLLSNASNTAPDVASGIASGRPFNYGIRGAAYDLTNFPDFNQFIEENFASESIVPYKYQDKVYGMTETQDFYVMFYRKDIFEGLNLTPPDTWEELKAILPKMKRNSMDFYIPAAGWAGYKPFYTTVPFIYQYGGRVYKEDGAGVDYTNARTLEGLKLLTDLFRLYSMPVEVPNFFNDFRYGKVPAGVSSFSTYLWLSNAVPELEGMWDIVPSPGVANADGEVLRYQIAADRALMISEQSDKKEQAWEYVKWWMSKETQVEFGNLLQVSFGPEYMWNSANLNAFAELPFKEEHKRVILEQWQYIKELPPHPAYYITERTLSDLWNDVVVSGMNLRLAADRNSVDADREILLKLEEFGYIKDGVITPYQIQEWRDSE